MSPHDPISREPASVRERGVARAVDVGSGDRLAGGTRAVRVPVAAREPRTGNWLAG